MVIVTLLRTITHLLSGYWTWQETRGNSVGHVSPHLTQMRTGLEELTTIKCNRELMGKPLTGTEKGMAGEGEPTKSEFSPCWATASSIFLNETYVCIYNKILSKHNSLFNRINSGLERWLSGQECFLLFSGTWVWLPAPTQVKQLIMTITPALGEPIRYPLLTPTAPTLAAYTCRHINNKKIFS